MDFSQPQINQFTYIYKSIQESVRKCFCGDVQLHEMSIIFAERFFCSRGYYEIKNKCRWTTDKFWLNNSQEVNGMILRFAYRTIDVQRRTCMNFWDFCCSYHQIIAV